jgi:hypothetical protein
VSHNLERKRLTTAHSSALGLAARGEVTRQRNSSYGPPFSRARL